jgi:hypothetical protein
MSRSFRRLLLAAVAATAACSSSTAPSAPLTPPANGAASNDQATPSNVGGTRWCADTESCLTP